MIKGLLTLLAIFCLLVGLLVWAKTRPANAATLSNGGPVALSQIATPTR